MATDLRDLELYLRYDEGSGPPIVYLHGINSDASDWRVVIDTIGPGYRHIAFDLLGFGESPKPLDIDYTADDHTQTIDAALERLGLSQPFLLVGYSLGGDIAVRYASTYPHKLRRLFLLSTPFYLPAEVFGQQGFGAQYVQLLAFKWAWRFLAGAKKDNDVIYQLASGRLQDAAKQFLRTDDVPKHWDIMSKNLTNCIGRADFVNDLPKFTMPVTFALGVRDVIVHPDQTPALKALHPDMEIRRIVGLNADHFMLVSLPEKVATEIMRDEIKTLHVAVRAGAGDPPIVLLHGLAGTATSLKPLAQTLAVSHEVVALDLLGFGESMQSQTLRYTLEDHSIAVRNTLRSLFPGRPVRLVGQGLGANVALGAAALDPETVADVVAFSPALVPPGRDLFKPDGITDDVAEVLAAREQLHAIARDPRIQAIASDKTLNRVVPAARSVDNAILAVDPVPLLRRQRRPVRFVLPTEDKQTDAGFLHEQAAARPDFTMSRPEGPYDMPTMAPGRAAIAIEPNDPAIAEKALRARPRRRHVRSALADAVRSVENQLLLRGLLEMLGGLILLSLHNEEVGRSLLTFGFAVWVTWEGVFTIVGSFGLRREKKGWVTYFLLGLLALAVGAFLLANRDATALVVGLVIAARAIYVGATNILVARKVGQGAPKPKWLLYLQGLLGVVIGVSIIFVPALGGPLLRVTIGGYFLASGFLLVAQAWVSKRRTRAEIKRLSYES